MRFLLSWIQEFINIDLPPKKLDDLLTLAGLEVDGIENFTFQFKDVIIAKIEKCEPHPQADRLKITTVFDGKNHLQVVCGDPDVTEGMVVAFAPVGSKLQEKSGKTFTLAKAKLRGVESFGMLCAEDELMLTKKKCSGIMTLPKDAPVGENLAQYLYDPIFDISLTPNLGHAASILGVARELSAQLKLPYKMPKVPPSKVKKSGPIQCKIEATDACSQYLTRVIKGVKIGESPSWLKSRLEKSGFNTINNVVDSINYVMMELGQPMHAFDLAKLSAKELVVRKNANPLNLKTLDGEEKHVPANTLLIYDGKVPVAVAGLIGGDDSAITEQSTDIVIESAQFAPLEVRKSMKVLATRTDSSYRFEKGIDPLGTQLALDRVCDLICELTGGKAEDTVAAIATQYSERQIKCRLTQIERIIGIHLSQNEVSSMLKRLECHVRAEKEGLFIVTPPSYRNDIHTEIEVIEEIARLYGFNNIERTKCRFSTSTTEHHPLYLMEKSIRERLCREGLHEFLTCNLISPLMSTIGLDESLNKENLISVMHAKSIDQSILRASFLPGLLMAIKHNENHQNHDISAFEIGTLHFKDGDKLIEKQALAIILSGKRAQHHFCSHAKGVDFFDLKGHVSNLLIALGIDNVEFKRSQFSSLHPGKQCEVMLKNEVVGVLGEVHPNECSKLDIDSKKRLYFAQLDVEKLMAHKLGKVIYSPLPQFPSSTRDITLTISEKTELQSLYDLIAKAKTSHLRNVELVDIFKDEQKVGKGLQNITLRLIYRNDDSTIEMQQVDDDHNKIAKLLNSSV